MAKYYTDKEINALLKEMTVIADTREQVNYNVLDFLDKNKIPYISRKLNTGDYSAMLGEQTLETEVVCERKASLDELCGNLTADRDRFEREFIRAKSDGLKVFLVIENASWTDIVTHNYKSQLKPQSLIASLLSWQARFNVTIVFCRPQESGMIIYYTLMYWLRENLKKGKI